MTDLGLRPAAELRTMLASKELSSAELIDHYLTRINKLNGDLNAVVTIDADHARAEARRADDLTARGEKSGVLHGLPMTVKDTFETAGMRTTSGAPMLSGHVPKRDADAVARLRDAGAIVLGKSNTPMFASDCQTHNDVFGVTNNPWEVSRTVGGSSGGSGAAMAAGFSALELGSDIAGSVRIPAHYCGVYGHKPSYGIVPLRGHIPGPPGSLFGDTPCAVAGPLARSAADLRLALRALAAAKPSDALAWTVELPQSRHEQLSDFRVGVWLDDESCSVDDAVLTVLERVADALAKAGATIDRTSRPCTLGEARRLHQKLIQPAMVGGLPAEEFERLVTEARSVAKDDDSPRARFVRDATQSASAWLATLEEREQLRARCADYFRDVDVLLTPTTVVTAPRHDTDLGALRRIVVNGKERDYWEQIPWCSLASAAHLPSTVAPVGRASDGLPVGVQVLGPFLEDLTTIRFAELLADLVGGFESPPDVS